MKRIIIDADTGVDDSLAILYALRSPNFRVEGITTCFGNNNAEQSADNSLRLIKLSGCGYEVPVAVGAQLSFYTQALDVGRSSIQMLVEVWSDDPLSSEWRKVTEAVFVFVAIDGSGRTRPVPPRRG